MFWRQLWHDWLTMLDWNPSHHSRQAWDDAKTVYGKLASFSFTIWFRSASFWQSCLRFGPDLKASSAILTWLPRIMPRLVLFFLQCFGVLTLMCLDRPKWSDSMTSHNFGDHRIAPKRAILCLFLKPVNFGTKKIQKSLRTAIAPKRAILWKCFWWHKTHLRNFGVHTVESPQLGWLYEHLNSTTQITQW
jgi:hypothetical protein